MPMPPNTSSLRSALYSPFLSPYRRALLTSSLSFSPALGPLSRNGPTSKHASTSSKKAASKSHRRVLEKPEKFNPPSHPSRRVLPGHRALPLPPLSPKQEEERRTKKYPGMRFHEGSVMYWFLTTRWIHVWITLSTLIFFSIYTFLNVFLQSSPFVQLLPPRDSFYTHPLQFLQTYFQVWKMTTEYESARIKEKRDKNLEDLEKRRKYAKVHGLDHEYWFFGWGLEGLRDTDGGSGDKRGVDVSGSEGEEKAAVSGGRRSRRREDTREDQGVYLDWDGKRKPLKKWFGIW